MPESYPQKVSPWGFVGMGALACLLFLDLAALLIGPWWAVLVLLVAWVVLFARACRWFTRAPVRVAWSAAGGLVLWLVVEVAGGLWVW
ncbi:hypothetical protein P5P86_11965 [Nocardioides sp. BP30]|uniref:hypothetical protein n=1 Tax=Nocardioides sp. BP30 TaxID=3036374 RepID=UPI0024682AA1|nr:hypothetical protein [Nocardioides sp. BP30]WGL50679.1 hypothetical protein P5P86_11965 [Nocardioides sp. BP30]